MDYQYPFSFIKDLDNTPKVHDVYNEICDFLFESDEGAWQDYSDIYDIVDGRLAEVTVKHLLCKMDYAGVISRRKTGKGKFSPFDLLRLTPCGYFWLENGDQ